MLPPAGTRIPVTPPGGFNCGTHTTGWLNGTHPQQPGSTIEVIINIS